jgi:hypothetical protein
MNTSLKELIEMVLNFTIKIVLGAAKTVSPTFKPRGEEYNVFHHPG